MNSSQVPDTESVARILSPEWIEEGVLLHEAFMLRPGETYISVNRPSVETYSLDIADFINRHPNFSFGNSDYKRALLKVGDIRDIDISLEGVTAKIDVGVEPRDSHYKSHAGIYTRFQDRNVKRGQTLTDASSKAELSADTILLEVRMNLLDISQVETYSFDGSTSVVKE